MSKITRKAEANWKGDLDSGHGLVSTESRVLTESRFSFEQRVEGEGTDTNPEELIAASAASCFAMALSKTLQDEDRWMSSMESTLEALLRDAPAGAADRFLRQLRERLAGARSSTRRFPRWPSCYRDGRQMRHRCGRS